MKNYEDFLSALKYNIQQRSRTASGKQNNASSFKIPLLLEGDELLKKVDENMTTSAALVWGRGVEEGSGDLRPLFVKWFDVLQEGLIPYEKYKPMRESLEESWGALVGRKVVIDPRYRLWEVHYDTARIQPYEIEKHFFYYTQHVTQELRRGECFSSPRKYAEFLAFADRQFDRVIHPWLDGCGRFATLVVMWIAQQSNFPYPRFKSHSEHYASMTTLSGHIAYYEEITQ